MRTMLEVGECEMTGDIGLFIAGMPRYGEYGDITASTSGFGVAHDLIEHVNGPSKIGSIEDELEALGALVYTRVQHGEMNRNGIGSAWNPHQHVAFDIVRMAGIAGQGFRLYDVPKTRAGSLEAELDEIISFAADRIMDEVCEDGMTHNEAKQYLADARHFMRLGIRKIHKRFGCAHKANTLFWNVSNEVDRQISEIVYPGQQFELRYSLDGDVSFQEQYEEEW